MGSYPTRDWTCIPCIGRWIPSHWTTGSPSPSALALGNWQNLLSFLQLQGGFSPKGVLLQSSSMEAHRRPCEEPQTTAPGEKELCRLRSSMLFSLVFLFQIALLRCNSHIIKSTLLKHTIQWFLVSSQGCASITTIQFRNSFITSKRNLIPLTPSLQPPETTNLLSVCIDLPVLDILYKWNVLDILYKWMHTTCGLLCLASFI